MENPGSDLEQSRSDALLRGECIMWEQTHRGDADKVVPHLEAAVLPQQLRAEGHQRSIQHQSETCCNREETVKKDE